MFSSKGFAGAFLTLFSLETEYPLFVKEPPSHISAEMEKVVDIPCQARGDCFHLPFFLFVCFPKNIYIYIYFFFSPIYLCVFLCTRGGGEVGKIIIPFSLSRNTAAGHRVVQRRGAHQPGEDPPVPGAGRGQPANQRSPAGRHGHVPVLRPQSGGRAPDQHLPGCYK